MCQRPLEATDNVNIILQKISPDYTTASPTTKH